MSTPPDRPFTSLWTSPRRVAVTFLLAASFLAAQTAPSDDEAAKRAALAKAPPAAAHDSATELAKQTQNPIASLISVPLQSTSSFGLGDREATGTILNIQPVIPFAISPSTNIILRVIMPLTSQPSPDGTSRYSGVGDVLTTVFFSPSRPGPLIWGVGPVFLLPTATNKNLGGEKFATGPSVVALVQPGKWTIGGLTYQIWSTSGAIDRVPVNQFYVQPFCNYNLGKGLAVALTAELSASWHAKEVWNGPLLFNVTKVTLLGKRPVQIGFAAGPMVARPAGGASWLFRLQMNFLFPR